ncbi:HEAT repeat domain-containing protein [Planctomyces sp. SH-PL14]|uniref:HEAT repeat domain-containing protein n=1 Tax=Planctomyces sp. SH-PL14 TaxID=1632864 RepID=UPI00078C5F16|nr:HEAT repeat domain-containing protein [Planctomyces sp. SH-PL14]AMV16824.1 HEAT repeat protein [Planctomyces sp. SH-PL14]
MKGFVSLARRLRLPLGAALLLSAGCGGTSTPPSDTATEVSSAPGNGAAQPSTARGASPQTPGVLTVPGEGRSRDLATLSIPLIISEEEGLLVPTETGPPISPAAEKAWRNLMRPDLAAEQWDAAQQALVELGAEATPLLNRELGSSEEYHREIAATLVAQLGTPSEATQKALLPLLDDKSLFVRANAAAALAPVAEHSETVVPVLTKLLKADDPQLRKMAAMNLSSFGKEAAPEVATLAAALEDSDAEVVLPVVQLLGRIGPRAEPAMQRLQQIAFEQEGEVKRAAQTAIEQIRTSANE